MGTSENQTKQDNPESGGLCAKTVVALEAGSGFLSCCAFPSDRSEWASIEDMRLLPNLGVGNPTGRTGQTNFGGWKGMQWFREFTTVDLSTGLGTRTGAVDWICHKQLEWRRRRGSTQVVYLGLPWWLHGP